MPSSATQVAFYRGFLKLAPHVAKLEQKESMVILKGIFETTFSVVATREHILSALTGDKKNTQKRKWDLKQQFIVAQFLANPTLSTPAVGAFVKERFGQRTRPTVIDSCRTVAAVLKLEKSADELARFCRRVANQVAVKSGDVDVLT